MKMNALSSLSPFAKLLAGVKSGIRLVHGGGGGVNGVLADRACRSLWMSSCPCGIGVKHVTSYKGLRKATGVSSSCVPFSTSVASPSAVSSEALATTSGQKEWDLYAGIVLERKPVITQLRDATQEKYMKYLSQLEFEMSKKSDHEVRHDNDLRMMEKVKSGEAELGNIQTARDAEDRWSAERKTFTPAKRETEADLKNDVKSLERALDSHLLLLVEQRLGNSYRWVCPHAKLGQGETLRQAAERMIREIFPEMRTKVLGHAPWGFYKYKYPKDSGEQSAVGAKVFFYKAQVISGEPKVTKDKNTGLKDFVWLKRDELASKLQPEYHKKLAECLIDE